jgi:uncharacterized membrane protein
LTNRWGTARAEAFSDGVFAIAITLLVLDLNVPESDLDELWRGILDQWPAYLGYVTSFAAIGGIWLAHHGIFRRLRYVNEHVMRLNLLLLMAVSFLPFPTRLVAETIGNEDAERVAVVFYGLALLAIALAIGGLWAAVLADRELLRPEVTEDEVRAITRSATPNVAAYVVGTAVAFVFPTPAAFAYLVIALLSVLRAPGDRITGGARPERA